jgi:hypothetical protein
MRVDLASVQANLGHEFGVVKTSLSAEIATLSAAVDHALTTPSVPIVNHGGDAAGLFRHCSTQQTRGTMSVMHEFPPVRGTDSDRTALPLSNPNQFQHSLSTESSHPGPRVDFPQFDGANPKLWHAGLRNTSVGGEPLHQNYCALRGGIEERE